MTAPMTVLCAGRLYCDLVFTDLDAAPAAGREVFAGGLNLRAGGGAFITAAYLGREGLEAGLITTRPAAPFDQLLDQEIAGAGITAHFVDGTACEAPQVTVAFPQNNDRAFLTRRVGAAIPPLSALPKAAHLHIGELTTALEHGDLIPMARAAGMTISLDCAWDAAALGQPGIAQTIASVDLFFPNEAEQAELARNGVSAAPRIATIVKRGVAGAEYRPATGNVLTAPAFQAVVRDLTGAGDAFNGGFLAAWLAGRGPSEALIQGNRLGAEAVSQIGGFGAPTSRPEGNVMLAAGQ
ncbi:carbohydrate kinase family protein [Gymnodinialimonas sp. 2305UL16-5]|uniref:carbohydrate kinase family protein n=1 Tax=Gymnodinialimonas mytili TaxID=3126503 RepID=UPI0030AA6A0C